MPLCQFLGIPNWVIRLLHRYFKYFYSRSLSDSSLLLPQSAYVPVGVRNVGTKVNLPQFSVERDTDFA